VAVTEGFRIVLRHSGELQDSIFHCCSSKARDLAADFPEYADKIKNRYEIYNVSQTDIIPNFVWYSWNNLLKTCSWMRLSV
jgi:hypothetical protein